MNAPLLSKRANSLGTENAFVVLAEVNELIRQGKDVISFCIGQPDFPAPAMCSRLASMHPGWQARLHAQCRPFLS